MTKFHKVLRDKNMTTFELGRRLGYFSQQRTLKYAELGRQPLGNSSASLLLKICKILDVELEDILEDYELDGRIIDLRNLKNLEKRFEKKFSVDDFGYCFQAGIQNREPCFAWKEQRDNGGTYDVIRVKPDNRIDRWHAEYSGETYDIVIECSKEENAEIDLLPEDLENILDPNEWAEMSADYLSSHAEEVVKKIKEQLGEKPKETETSAETFFLETAVTLKGLGV